MTFQKCEVGEPPYAAVTGKDLPSSFPQQLSAVLGVFKRATAEYIRIRSYRAAERELHALDDRMLRDIGISRSEISSALTHAAYERRNGQQPTPY